MDLLRRSAAGELAELFGERALAARPRTAAVRLQAPRRSACSRSCPTRQVAWLTAYTQGVNAGLADLGARPPEYWLFGARPQPWRNEDSLLVVFGLYTRLSNNEAYERPQGVLHDGVAGAALRVPDAVDVALRPPARRHGRRPDGRLRARRRSRGPDVVDLRTRAAPRASPRGAARRAAARRTRVEPVGARRVAHGARRRDPRERPASRPARAEHLLSLRAAVARRRAARREHPGSARDPDRRERHARVGRDREQRGSERLGRRRRGRRAIRAATRPPTAASRSRPRCCRSRSRAATPSRSSCARRVGGRSPAATGAAGRSRCTRRGSSRGGLNLDLLDLASGHERERRRRGARALGRAVAELDARGLERPDRAGP